MNSEKALNVVELLAAGGKLVRVSSTDRATKAIVFRTSGGGHLAVEINVHITEDQVIGVRCEHDASGEYGRKSRRLTDWRTAFENQPIRYRLRSAIDRSTNR